MRRASSLVELMVFLGIVSLIVALALPAILKARAASQRVQCSNNLHQLGVALHTYHSSNNQLPAGYNSDKSKSPLPFTGWPLAITPFLERDDLWLGATRAYAENKWFLKIPPHWGMEKAVPALVCPADGRIRQPVLRGDHFRTFTSYLGVEGVNQTSLDGVLYVDSKVRLSDIHDGSSNTIMLGERPPSANFVLGWWYAGWGQNKDGSGEMLLSVREINVNKYYPNTCPRGPYEFVADRVDNPCAAFHFWSVHTGGAYFLFADGAVRFLNYSVNPLMPALATRSGGEVVDISQLQ
jgi:prepilin-type processing-associated H-X9-DG protein